MQTVISPASLSGFINNEKYHVSEKVTIGWFSRFTSWCAGEEENRMLWLALTFLGLIGVAVPVTLAFILMLGNNNFALWIMVCTVNVPVMAIGLAAQPTKVIIPFLFAAWALDLTIILYCVASFFAQ